MEVISTAIPDVKIIKPTKHGDHRGFFSETYNAKALKEAGIDIEFVQDNQSLSVEKGVIRGLHFQTPPFAQDKLVRCVRGSLFDVAVDLRKDSPTYGQHVSAVISADEWNQILVPVGFAHGFMTLEPNTEAVYKVSNYYGPKNDFGIKWDDPALGIEWPLDPGEVVISEKDLKQPLLADIAADLPF